MLHRVNRLVSAADYRNTVRRGRRKSGDFVSVYLFARNDEAAPRFGFIVAKTVGNAVTRNLIRRRLKSVARSSLTQVPTGTDVVFRALPGARDASWTGLLNDAVQALRQERRR